MNNRLTKDLIKHHLNSVLTDKKGFKSGIYHLKQYPRIEIVSETAKRLMKLSNNFIKYFYGNPMPKELNRIGVVDITNFYANDLKIEVQWLFLSLKKYRAELSIFVNLKDTFENFFIIGEYKKAQEILDQIISHTGLSIWSVTSQLLIYEYTSKQDKAKLYLSEILTQNKKGVFTSSLVNFISQRVEKKLSAYKYDSDLKGSLGNVKTNLDRANRDYYNFQLNFFETEKFEELKNILGFDYNNSVVDRYFTLRKLLIYSICKGIDVEYMVSNIKKIQNIIPDNLFNSIMLLGNSKEIDNSFFDIQYLKIIDLYYSGLYQEVVESIREYIKSNNVNFTIINLYSRSLVLGNLEFKSLKESPCLLNEIADNIYKIYQRNSNPIGSIYSLYQISKNINHFDINFQLNSFIKKEQNVESNDGYFFFTLPKLDPKLIQLLNNKPVQLKDIVETVISKTYNSIAISYNYNTINGDFESIEGISNEKINIDKAIYLYEKEYYPEALIKWKEIFNSSLEIPPIKEVAIRYIFQILNKLELLDECIKWYTDNYIQNMYSIYKIDASDIHKKLRKGKFKNITNNIYLPIFISLISSDENEKGFALELFCKKNDAKLPSDLINDLDISKDNFFEVFYNISCSNETLGNYRHIHGTREQLEERINICNYLVKQYPINREFYSQELGLLTNELIIYEGTQKLDESKIYANDQAILNREINEFEGLYNRYMTIAGLYLKNIKILTVNKNELRFLNKKNEIEYDQNEIEYSTQGHIDSFSNIFSVIRDKFLYSKFGIVTYISTRIRHGVFLGELRPELEKKGLIFFKNKLLDKYEPNSFWLRHSNVDEHQRNMLIEAISSFSEEIDNLITSIIKNNIQIKIQGENEEGWFDYDFYYNELENFAVELYYEDNYKDFSKRVLDILWSRTDVNLESIRNTLQNEIKFHFTDILNNFESKLHVIFGSTENFPQIFTSLSSCSTEIQRKIDKIATWFKRSGSTHSNFRLEPLIRIICKNVQRNYPLKDLTLSLESSFEKEIKGEYYQHFNDFLRIFVDNMLKHSIENDINCNVTIKKDQDLLNIILENNCPNEEVDIPLTKVGDGVAQLDLIKLVTEGKSGLMKAAKTIRDDLKNEENSLFFKRTKEHFAVVTSINYTQLIV